MASSSNELGANQETRNADDFRPSPSWKEIQMHNPETEAAAVLDELHAASADDGSPESTVSIPEKPCAYLAEEDPALAASTVDPDLRVELIKAILADPLLKYVTINPVEGWETRHTGTVFEPRGLVIHHTAHPAGLDEDYPALSVIKDGVVYEDGSYLGGPLAQFLLGRFGTVCVVAAGRANHAGLGGYKGLSRNEPVWGIEAENLGTKKSNGQPVEWYGSSAWRAEVHYAYPRLAAAIARATGFSPDMICSHHEWRPEKIPDTGLEGDAKSDPIEFMDYMDVFRAHVRMLLEGRSPRPVKALMDPADWRRGTAWSGHFEFFEVPRLAYLMGRGAGAFVYQFDLPDYDVEDSQASVTATLSSSHSGGGSDVTLFVNGRPYGTQQVQPLDPESGGAVYQWLLPESAFNASRTNEIQFKVLPDAQLRNGLSIFSRTVAPVLATRIRVSIPFEETAPIPQPTYDAEFVSQSVPTFMLAGNAYRVSITMRNIGDLAWEPGLRCRLGSEQPRNTMRWGSNRVELPDERRVEPGEEVTFSFDVRPQELGEQIFRWAMVKENYAWFGQRNAPVWVMVARDALFVSQSVPEAIVAGTTHPVSIVMQNIGTETWTREAGYRLGSQNPQDNTSWGFHRVELPHPVTPGSKVKFDFVVRAQPQAGRQNFQWQMLREGVGWLGRATPNVEVAVRPPLPKAAVFISQNCPTEMPPGSMQTLSITMRNIGTETWTTAAGCRLGSQNPPDNTRWGVNRLSLPHDVPPNADVAFTFSARIRDAEGYQNFQWQMVQDGGAGWFGQLTRNVEVRIALPLTLFDVWFIKFKNTGSGTMELHTATRGTDYVSGVSTATRFSAGEANNGWWGLLPNDLYFVKTKNTGSGMIEVHTAARRSGYTSGLSSATRFSVADAGNGRFGVLPNGDVWFLKTKNTGTGRIEAHTVTAASGFQSGVSMATRFTLADADNGLFGMLANGDVWCVKTKNTGTGKIEVHTATVTSGFQSGRSAATRFNLPDADNSRFRMLPNGDVYGVKTKNTGSGKVEAHTATAASGFQSGLSKVTRFTLADVDNGWFGML